MFEKLEDIVSTVAAEEADSEQAHIDRVEAEAEVVEDVLQKAQPALRAIGTRPVIRYRNGELRKEERYEFRCVPLCRLVVSGPLRPAQRRGRASMRAEILRFVKMACSCLSPTPASGPP